MFQLDSLCSVQPYLHTGGLHHEVPQGEAHLPLPSLQAVPPLTPVVSPIDHSQPCLQWSLSHMVSRERLPPVPPSTTTDPSTMEAVAMLLTCLQAPTTFTTLLAIPLHTKPNIVCSTPLSRQKLKIW